MARTGHWTVEGTVVGVVHVTTQVLRVFRPSFPEVFAAFGEPSVLLGRTCSWRRGGSVTDVAADYQAGQKGQVGSVSLIVGIVRRYDDSAARDLATHVEHDIELRGGGLKVCRAKGDGAAGDGSGSGRVSWNAEGDVHRGAGGWAWYDDVSD